MADNGASGPRHTAHLLSATVERLGWGLRDARQWLIQRGWWPAALQALATPDGQRWTLHGEKLYPRHNGHKATGLLLPSSQCLWGTLTFANIPYRALDAAVQEALWRVCPLPPEQIVAAWHVTPTTGPEAAWQVEWGVCRCSTQEAALQQLGLPAAAPVWLAQNDKGVSGSETPKALPVRNATWQARQKRQCRRDVVWLAGLLLVIAALLSPAFVPILLKRQAVVLAMQHVHAAETRAAPLREQLDQLRAQTNVADGLHAAMTQSLPLASVMNQLAEVLPDDTWLDRMDINEDEVRITGLTDNAVELSALLARQPLLADVRAITATVRDNSTNKERFAFSMRWRSEEHQP